MPTNRRATLAAEAIDLPESERAQLALLLVESLSSESKNLWPESLVEELLKRADELRTGRVNGLTTEEVFGRSL